MRWLDIAAKVSVIIVSKNEEQRIGLCIESVLSAMASVQSYEVLLVDFGSTDRTLEVARDYSIRVIIVHEPDIHAAGFTLGFRETEGEYVLFLDGNRILEPSGFAEALSYLERHDDVGGVSGLLTSISDQSRSRVRSFICHRMKHFYDTLPTGSVKTLGGPVTLFKLSVMVEVGTWNPFAKSGEEAELGYRVRAAGYKLVRLPAPIAWQQIRCITVSRYLRRYEWGYNFGTGMSSRYAMRANRNAFLKRLGESYPLILLSFFAFYSPAGLVLGALGYVYPFLATAIGYCVLVATKYHTTKDVEYSLQFLLTFHLRIISSIGFICGFLKVIPNPDDFAPRVTYVK